MPYDDSSKNGIDNSVTIHVGNCIDVLKTLPEGHFHTCVTSPPYFGLRNYGVDGQIGLEPTPGEFVNTLVEVFREVHRVLRPDGTLWLNLGDSYARGFGGGSPGTKSSTNVGAYQDRKPGKVPSGFKGKDLLMIPSRVAIALQADGWYLRSHIIWHKPNVMPESVKDRPTNAHESIFLLTKSEKYYYDADAVREPHMSDYSTDVLSKATGSDRPVGNNFNKQKRYQEGTTTPRTRGERAALLHPLGRNRRNVWTVPTKPFRGAHFATFPPELIEPCIKAGSPVGGHVLDPFGGSGTTGIVANQFQRKADLIELNPDYAELARARIAPN